MARPREASPVTAIEEFMSNWAQKLNDIKSQYAHEEKAVVLSFEDDLKSLREKQEALENELQVVKDKILGLQDDKDDEIRGRRQAYHTSLQKHLKTAAEFTSSSQTHFQTEQQDRPIVPPSATSSGGQVDASTAQDDAMLQDWPPEANVGAASTPGAGSVASAQSDDDRPPTPPSASRTRTVPQRRAKRRSYLHRFGNASARSRSSRRRPPQKEPEPQLRKSSRNRTQTRSAREGLGGSGVSRRGTNGKTIEFEQVFQNGTAKVNHMIISFPKDSDHWYVLQCKQHSHKFGRNPLLGAARHLINDHGFSSRSYSSAIELLGVEVLNCDKEKAERNNAAFKPGGRGIPTPRATQTEVATESEHSEHTQRLDQPEKDDTAGTIGQGAASPNSDAITNPVAGELYSVYWQRTKSWYAAVVLPLGDFECVGINGSLFETDLAKHIPACYRFDKKARTTSGWENGYESDGPQVGKRRFPIMYFDEGVKIPRRGKFSIPGKSLLGWVNAKNFRRFDMQDPGSRQIYGFEAAVDFGVRLKMIRERRLRQSVSNNAATSSVESNSDADVSDYSSEADNMEAGDSEAESMDTDSIDAEDAEAEGREAGNSDFEDMETEDVEADNAAGDTMPADIVLRSFAEMLRSDNGSQDIAADPGSPTGSLDLGPAEGNQESEVPTEQTTQHSTVRLDGRNKSPREMQHPAAADLTATFDNLNAQNSRAGPEGTLANTCDITPPPHQTFTGPEITTQTERSSNSEQLLPVEENTGNVPTVAPPSEPFAPDSAALARNDFTQHQHTRETYEDCIGTTGIDEVGKYASRVRSTGIGIGSSSAINIRNGPNTTSGRLAQSQEAYHGIIEIQDPTSRGASSITSPHLAQTALSALQMQTESTSIPAGPANPTGPTALAGQEGSECPAGESQRGYGDSSRMGMNYLLGKSFRNLPSSTVSTSTLPTMPPSEAASHLNGPIPVEISSERMVDAESLPQASAPFMAPSIISRFQPPSGLAPTEPGTTGQTDSVQMARIPQTTPHPPDVGMSTLDVGTLDAVARPPTDQSIPFQDVRNPGHQPARSNGGPRDHFSTLPQPYYHHHHQYVGEALPHHDLQGHPQQQSQYPEAQVFSASNNQPEQPQPLFAGLKFHAAAASSSPSVSTSNSDGPVRRRRRRMGEVEREYDCGWNGCARAYGTLSHLNAHVAAHAHGPKRHSSEFRWVQQQRRVRKLAMKSIQLNLGRAPAADENSYRPAPPDSAQGPQIHAGGSPPPISSQFSTGSHDYGV